MLLYSLQPGAKQMIMHQFPIVPRRWTPRRVALVGVLLAGAVIATGCRSEAAAPVSDGPPTVGTSFAAPSSRETPPPAVATEEAVSQDRAALMAFYDATSGPDWEDNTNWGSTEPLGTWHGVTVNAQGRVVGLVLPDNALRGPLPAALGELTALEILDLSSDERSGIAEFDDAPGCAAGEPCPVGSGSFDPFGSDNVLRGPIPAAFQQLTALRVLNLSGSDLHSDLHSLFSWEPTVYDLATTFADLDGRTTPPHAGCFPELPNLEVLDLSNSWLSGPLPSFGFCENLEVLDLSKNWLAGPLPETLLGDALREVNLSGNWLRGGVGGGIFDDLPNLEVLNLSRNMLEDFGLWALSRAPNLKELDLSDNRLHGVYGVDFDGNFIDVWGDFPSLERLDLSSNALSGPLPPALGRLATLQALDLSDNAWSGPLPPEWGALASLQALDLSDNRLHGRFPPEWGTLGGAQPIAMEFLQDSRVSADKALRIRRGGLYREGGPYAWGLGGCIPYTLFERLSTWSSREPCLLRDLTLSGAILDPPFDRSAANSNTYTATVAAAADAVTVTAVPVRESIDVQITTGRPGSAAGERPSYGNGAAVPLAHPTEAIRIRLTGPPTEAGLEATQTVHVVVGRAHAALPSSDAPSVIFTAAWQAAVTRARAATFLLFGPTDRFGPSDHPDAGMYIPVQPVAFHIGNDEWITYAHWLGEELALGKGWVAAEGVPLGGHLRPAVLIGSDEATGISLLRADGANVPALRLTEALPLLCTPLRFVGYWRHAPPDSPGFPADCDPTLPGDGWLPAVDTPLSPWREHISDRVSGTAGTAVTAVVTSSTGRYPGDPVRERHRTGHYLRLHEPSEVDRLRWWGGAWEGGPVINAAGEVVGMLSSFYYSHLWAHAAPTVLDALDRIRAAAEIDN